MFTLSFAVLLVLERAQRKVRIGLEILVKSKVGVTKAAALPDDAVELG